MPDSYSSGLPAVGEARYRDPLTHIDWPQLRMPGAWLPQEALSLHGVPAFDALGAEARENLSRYEFINTLYCGLWLESIFLQRVSRLIAPGMAREGHAHLLHELREETGHSLMFLRAVDAGGVALPDGTWRAPRMAAALGRYAPAGGALFWLAMLIGEHVSDSFNRLVIGAQENINPAVRDICSLHSVDEARHIAHAQRMLAAALSARGAAGRAMLAVAARVLLAQMAAVFYFPLASFYALAGLPAHTDWHALARNNPARRRFVAESLAPTRQLLQEMGLRQAMKDI